MIGRLRLGGLALAMAGVLAAAPAGAHAAERYVVPSGGLASGQCANPDPGCTFAYASQGPPSGPLTPGDEIVLAAGTYTFNNAFPIPNVGSIRVRAASPAQRPVFQLNNTPATFNAATDLADLTFTGSPGVSPLLVYAGRRAERIEVRSSAGGIDLGNSDNVLADSLVLAGGGPAIAVPPGNGNIRVRGVTAIANGAGAFGVHVEANQSGAFNNDSHANLNSVIARGPGGDLAGTVESTDAPPPTATISARRSNYRTTTGDLTVFNGGGNQTSPAQTGAGALFVNAAAGNYRLRAGSPAVDAGELTFDNGAFDLDAGPRTLGAAMDIGAYERAYLPPVPPETELTKAPKRKITTRKKRVRLVYRFTSPDAGATFECTFGRAGFKPCGSPFRKRVKATKKARTHRFAVRAVSEEGMLDPSPAQARSRVKRKR